MEPSLILGVLGLLIGTGILGVLVKIAFIGGHMSSRVESLTNGHAKLSSTVDVMQADVVLVKSDVGHIKRVIGMNGGVINVER